MSRGFTKPWLFGLALMNIIGGRSSTYQLAAISTMSTDSPFSSGFIQFAAGPE